MSDLVKRLREYEKMDAFRDRKTFKEAADAIERLERELSEARALAERSTRRLVELSAPGSIGAFAARDHWQERAERAEAERDRLREVIERVLDGVPAHHEGSFIIEHLDGDGEYIGSEEVNPLDVVFSMVGALWDAIDAAKGEKP